MLEVDPLSNQQLQRDLRQARAELAEFTHSVSHDLRASLRHVTAYVEIIREDLCEQPAQVLQGHLDTVSQAARQMGRQIDGLMALSRVTQVALELAVVDVGQVVREVCATWALTPDGRLMAWQLAPDFPALRCDVGMLRQVLAHLLSNAYKFTATRTRAEIKVDWQVHEGGLCALMVSDNGIGFNPQYTGKLFQAFQRLHSAREFEGLGMGLALTRKMVERHGGSAWACGVPDAGCCISFTLPLALVAA